MLVERANMFLCRNSFKTIQDIVQRLVPECPQCFCKMKYFCVDQCCLHSQPVCFNCSKDKDHKHFLHNLNRVELLHLDKQYLPRQVDAFKKKHQEVKELVQSNRTAYIQVIEQYTHYVNQLEQYMKGLEDSLEKSIKNKLLGDLLLNPKKINVSKRNQYWKLLESMRLKQVHYELLPDKYSVLSINRIRKQIEGIIEKYSSLTFEQLLTKNHMRTVFDYDQINKHFITNVFGNLEDRTLKVCDQEIDPQIIKNLNRLIIEQASYFQQDDLPHSIKQLQYLNFDCSQPAIFPQKIQSLLLNIQFNSYSTFKFSNYFLPNLVKLRIYKYSHCINTSIQYQHLKSLKSLKYLQIYDQGISQQMKRILLKQFIIQKMRVIRICPDNSVQNQTYYFKHMKGLIYSQKICHSSLQYLSQQNKEKLLQRIISLN